MKYLISILLTCISSSVQAFDCLPISDDEAFQKADVVLLARIIRAELITENHKNIVIASFDVVSTFKGDHNMVTYIKSNTSSEPNWEPLIVGESYLIFSKAENSTFIPQCNGSRHFIELNETKWLKKYKVVK